MQNGNDAAVSPRTNDMHVLAHETVESALRLSSVADRVVRSWRVWSRLSVRLGTRLVSPFVLVALWEIASHTQLLPPQVIASPSSIVGTLGELARSGALADHLWVSSRRAATGLGIGILIGSALALVAGLSRAGEVAVDSSVQMLRTLPFLALVPLFILWFGIGEMPKIALIAFGTVFPIYIALYSGIRSVDPKLIEAATTLGLSRFDRILHVILPGALPSCFVGLRYALGVSWLALAVVEQINATAGIGYLINDARDFMRTDVIVVCLLIYSILGLATDALVRVAERFALAWRPSFIRS